MDQNQKKLLEKHAEHYYEMARFITESSDEELTELLAACRAAGTTNCGWATYAAAQHLVREVQSEIEQRARRLAEPADIKSRS